MTIFSTGEAQTVLKSHYPGVHKFGLNLDIDTTTDPEDVWTVGGKYSFPSAAAATTIVSDDTNDDGAPLGTGARTVEVQGLDSDWLLTTETVTMDGTSAVTLTTQFLRVFRAKVLTVGSGGVNAGTIQVKHGSTVLAEISAGSGQTLMAIYTVPDDYLWGELHCWSASQVGGGNTADIEVRLCAIDNDGSTRVQAHRGIKGTGDSSFVQPFTYPIRLQPKTDVFAEVLSTDTNNVGVSATFDLYFMPKRV